MAGLCRHTFVSAGEPSKVGHSVHLLFVQRSAHHNVMGWVVGLEDAGHTAAFLVSLLTPKTPDRAEVVVVPRFERLSRLFARIFGLPSMLKVEVLRPVALWRAIRACSPDVVVLKTQGFSTVFVSVLAAIMGVPRLAWTQLPPHRAARWLVLARCRIMPRAWMWVATPELSAKLIDRRGWDHQHVPLAIDVQLPRDQSARQLDSDVESRPLGILTVGTFGVPRKRLEWALEAASHARLFDEHAGGSKAALVFVGHRRAGERTSDDLRQRAAAIGAESAVTFRYDVPHADMAAIYAENDVLVLPSEYEPFGMAALEAMAAGLTVVVTDAAGVSGLIDDGVTGCVVPSDDLAALTERLAWLARHRREAIEMGLRAQRFVAAYASPAVCAAQIEQQVIRARQQMWRHSRGAQKRRMHG